MTDPQRKLTVRVKLAPESGSETPGTPKYSYRWGRIALVGVALVLLAALVFRALLAPEKEPGGGTERTADTIIATAPPGPETSPGTATPTESPAPPTPAQPNPVDATPEAVESVPAAPADRATPSAPAEVTPVAAPRETVADAAPGSAQQGEAGTPEPAAVISQSAPTIESGGDNSVESPPAQDRVLTAGATRILADSVTRFVLTDEVRDREPVGSVSDIRARPPGAPLAIFAFSDVRGLRGETLRYRWIREDRVMAEVKVRVGSNRWRSYSSKFISDKMRGPWRVELRNSAGELLAQADFEY